MKIEIKLYSEFDPSYALWIFSTANNCWKQVYSKSFSWDNESSRLNALNSCEKRKLEYENAYNQ